MSLIRIDRRPPRRQLLVFATIWLAFFGGMGALIGARSTWQSATGVWCVAALAPILAACWTEGLRLLYVGAAYLAYPIGLVLSYVSLGALYYLVLTPVGLLMRSCGYDPMNLGSKGADADSFWVERGESPEVDRYFKQF